jgi:hypothetical protein
MSKVAVARVRALIVGTGLLAVLIVSPASARVDGTRAAAINQGDALRAEVRNGTTSRETEIIGDIAASTGSKGGYVTRQSNVDTGGKAGGGAIYGCRGAVGGTAAGSAPCLRASNLAAGLAFEFSTGGLVGGLISVGNPAVTNSAARPFTTNATAVATGLNADRVDGQDAAQVAGQRFRDDRQHRRRRARRGRRRRTRGRRWNAAALVQPTRRHAVGDQNGSRVVHRALPGVELQHQRRRPATGHPHRRLRRVERRHPRWRRRRLDRNLWRRRRGPCLRPDGLRQRTLTASLAAGRLREHRARQARIAGRRDIAQVGRSDPRARRSWVPWPRGCHARALRG